MVFERKPENLEGIQTQGETEVKLTECTKSEWSEITPLLSSSDC